jgi:predicted HTH domain antitoxin
MLNLSIELPETVAATLGKTPQEFIDEMRVAAAIKWYEIGEISQERAADIAGLGRAEFIEALSRYQVDFMQYTEQELAEEMSHVA